MSKKWPVFPAGLCAVALLCAVSLQAQTLSPSTQSNGSSGTLAPAFADPGPRPVGNTTRTLTGAKLQNQIPNGLQPKDPDLTSNNDGAGQVIANGGPTAGFWFQALTVFGQEATPNGASNGNGINTIAGLGPAFNGNSCFVCHSQPTIGGSSPAVNPQVALATLDGATNTVPSFVTLNGPIQEARFILDLAHDPSGSTLDGGVHELFTIQGRNDAPAGCVVSQPDFATEIGRHNLITRLPIPTFGEGFIENITEAALVANLAANAATKNNLGIFGRFNTNGNDGTITRFGWKAQNKSLLLFSGEAANVELGVTNELNIGRLAREQQQGLVLRFPAEAGNRAIIPVGVEAAKDSQVVFRGSIGSQVGLQSGIRNIFHKPFAEGRNGKPGYQVVLRDRGSKIRLAHGATSRCISTSLNGEQFMHTAIQGAAGRIVDEIQNKARFLNRAILFEK